MMKKTMILAIMAVTLLVAADAAMAASYYSFPPGKEVCTSIQFGNDGGGEYTLMANDPGYPDEPWIDNHYTSFVSGPNNIISVPLCFSSIGRSLSETTNIQVIVETPTGNVTHSYGICVDSFWDTDVISGEATGNACDIMGAHTDLFSAAFLQPTQYASPGASVEYSLILDSDTPMTISISKGAGTVQLSSSAGSVDIDGSEETVKISMTAPQAEGTYDFSVVASVNGCSADDCVRTIEGTLVVADPTNTPQAGFYATLSPETKSILDQGITSFTVSVRNFGNGQTITVLVSADEGIETDFSGYTSFIETGETKNIKFNVRPITDEKKTYEIKATVKGADQTQRTTSAWLTVDELTGDASKLGAEDLMDDINNDGVVTLEEWDSLQSMTGNVIRDDAIPGDSTPEGTNWLLYMGIIIIVAAAVAAGYFFYTKKQKGGSGPTWESIGA